MDLLNGNVRTLYLKYLGAALGSTLIMSIYSIVDTIAIGQYAGPPGTATVATFFPLCLRNPPRLPFVAFGIIHMWQRRKNRMP